jgi:hypothetical protein
MDPMSLDPSPIYSSASALGVVLMELVSQLIRGHQRDGLRKLLPSEDRFLKVFDLNPDDDSTMQQQIPVLPPIPTADRGEQVMTDSDNVSNSLGALPNQTQRSIRIYIEHDFDQVQYYKGHFNHLKGSDAQLDYGSPSQRGYEALAAQWRSFKPTKWCDAYMFLICEENFRSTRLLGRRPNPIGGAKSFARSLVQTLKQACVLESDNGNLTG